MRERAVYERPRSDEERVPLTGARTSLRIIKLIHPHICQLNHKHVNLIRGRAAPLPGEKGATKKRFENFCLSQGHNLALTVLFKARNLALTVLSVPNSLNSGLESAVYERAVSGRRSAV